MPMREEPLKPSVPQHRILVPKHMLTSKGLMPSSQELFDLMHLTSCDHAINRWKKHWSFCPVCLTTADEDGKYQHRTREEMLT